MAGFCANPVIDKDKIIHNNGLFTPALSLFQQSFELYLKALLCHKDFDISKDENKHHNLIKLAEAAFGYYPQWLAIKNDKEAHGYCWGS